MKVVSIVPIKMNSKRLKNKNLLPFGENETLLSNICKVSMSSDLIDETYVYSSSLYLQDHIPSEVKFLERDKKFDTDQTSMSEILVDFAEKVEADVYILLHSTAPFIRIESINKGIESVTSGEYDSSFAVTELKEFLWNEEGPINYDPERIPRTQDLKGFYVETSGFYIYKREIILEHGRRIGFNPKKIVLTDKETIDIDEKIDYDYALLQRGDNIEQS